MAWTEQAARRWYAGTIFNATGLLMRAMTALRDPRVVEWHEGCELPDKYAGLPSHPHECLADAVRAREQCGELRIMLGFSFREGIEQGIKHVTTLAPDGRIVDPVAGRLGPPGRLPARRSARSRARAAEWIERGRRRVQPGRLRSQQRACLHHA